MAKKPNLKSIPITELSEPNDTSDEPVFVLRAQDRIAPATVMAWAAQLDAITGGPSPKSNGARAIAKRMEAWQLEHTAKTPD